MTVLREAGASPRAGAREIPRQGQARLQELPLADVAVRLTADKLAAAGYFCVNAGPASWLHCLQTKHFGNPTVPVKVFSVDGTEFKGTELLLRPDIYVGQPCPQDGLEFWDYNADLDYMACHHFHTGHHD